MSKRFQEQRFEQAAMVRSIGARMKAARELCNLSQTVAAKRLGYANPSKLSKVEKASDTQSVPLWLLMRAAKVYEVSLDYLFGLSDDWETGPRMTQEREVSSWLFDTWEKARARDVETLRRLNNKITAVEEAVSQMVSASEEVVPAMTRFIEFNPQFEDMRAGSRLMFSIERIADAAGNARAKMQRFRIECALAANDTNQLSLAL